MKTMLAIAASLVVCTTALAESPATVPTPPVAPEPAATPEPDKGQPPTAAKWFEGIRIEGLVDGYVQYRPGTPPRSPAELRVFDAETATFNVAHAKLAFTKAADPAGFRLDLHFGAIARLTTFDPALINEVFQHLEQAFASYKFDVAGGLTVDFGRFVTTAGAEVIEAKDNLLYTRSLLFGWAIPFTHTGLRGTLALTEALTIQASLVNGWDYVLDNNAAKTLGLSITYAAPSKTTALLNVYAGQEGATPDWRVLFDVVVNQAVGDALTLSLNADYAMEGSAKWYGVSVMGRYALTEAVRLAARAEYFADPDGVRLLDPAGAALPASSVTEVTLGAGFLVGQNAEVRLEVRRDMASNAIFDAGGASSQNTVLVSGLAWF